MSVVALAITGDGVLTATVGIGHGSDEVDGVVAVVLRAGVITLVPGVAEEGGRCGCMAGDALMEVGVEVIGLRVGDTMLEGFGGGGGCWCWCWCT